MSKIKVALTCFGLLLLIGGGFLLGVTPRLPASDHLDFLPFVGLFTAVLGIAILWICHRKVPTNRVSNPIPNSRPKEYS